jgi:hypothetical protein
VCVRAVDVFGFEAEAQVTVEAGGHMKTEDDWPCAAGLTRRTEQLCGRAGGWQRRPYELVTPTTAELLRWWFG